MVRVITDYTDGRFSMWEAETDYAGPTVEITDEEWAEFMAFVAIEARWQARIGAIDHRLFNEMEAAAASERG